MTRDASPAAPGDTVSRSHDEMVLWPFEALIALAAVPAVWLALAVVLWVAHRWVHWPTAASASGLLYLAAAVGLVPVVLLILDGVARRGGAVKTPWASIDFGKGVEIEERPAVEIPTGLGFEGQPITDSSVAEVHKILNAARANEIVRLDLGTGDSWWMTRLFALCVGASRTGAPELLVFVGRDSGVDHAYLGWIGPRDALRLLRAERVQFRLALDRGESIGRYMTTVAPTVPPAPPPPLPPGDSQLAPFLAPATDYAQHADFQGLGEETALRVLLDLLGRYEQQQVPLGGERVTTAVLLSVFGSELHRQKIDVDWPHERQVDEFFATTDDHVAIVQADRFLRIVHRSLLENALLRQLLRPKETVSR